MSTVPEEEKPRKKRKNFATAGGDKLRAERKRSGLLKLLAAAGLGGGAYLSRRSAESFLPRESRIALESVTNTYNRLLTSRALSGTDATDDDALKNYAIHASRLANTPVAGMKGHELIKLLRTRLPIAQKWHPHFSDAHYNAFARGPAYGAAQILDETAENIGKYTHKDKGLKRYMAESFTPEFSKRLNETAEAHGASPMDVGPSLRESLAYRGTTMADHKQPDVMREIISGDRFNKDNVPLFRGFADHYKTLKQRTAKEVMDNSFKNYIGVGNKARGVYNVLHSSIPILLGAAGVGVGGYGLMKLIQSTKRTAYEKRMMEKAEREGTDFEEEPVKSARVLVSGRKGDFDVARGVLLEERRRAAKHPTTAQTVAGNFAKGHVRWNGLDVSIETPLRGWRRGTSPDGKAWKSRMNGGDYGYIRGVSAVDGDCLDILLGPHLESEVVFVVDQMRQETVKKSSDVLLWPSTPRLATVGHEKNATRPIETSGVSNLEGYARAMRKPQPLALSVLRREGDKGLLKLGRLWEFYPRHGFQAVAGDVHRPNGPRQRLLPGELSLGYSGRAGKELQKKSTLQFSGGRHDAQGNIGASGCEFLHSQITRRAAGVGLGARNIRTSIGSWEVVKGASDFQRKDSTVGGLGAGAWHQPSHAKGSHSELGSGEGVDHAGEQEFIKTAKTDHPWWDECKVIAGFRNQAEAKAAYLSCYEPGWRCGPITAMTLDSFRAYLRDGDMRRPCSEQAPFKVQLAKTAGLKQMLGRVVTNIVPPQSYNFANAVKGIKANGLSANLKAILKDRPAYEMRPPLAESNLPYRRMFGLPAHREGVGHFTKTAPSKFKFKFNPKKAKPSETLERIGDDALKAQRLGKTDFRGQNFTLGHYSGRLEDGKAVYSDRWDFDLNRNEKVEDSASAARWLMSKLTSPITIEGKIDPRNPLLKTAAAEMKDEPSTIGKGLGTLFSDFVPYAPSGARRAGAASLMAERIGEDPGLLLKYPMLSQVAAMMGGGVLAKPVYDATGSAGGATASAILPYMLVQALKRSRIQKIDRDYKTKPRKRLREVGSDDMVDDAVGSHRLGMAQANDAMRNRKMKDLGSISEAADALPVATTLMGLGPGASLPFTQLIDHLESRRFINKVADFSDQINGSTIPAYLAAAGMGALGLTLAGKKLHKDMNNPRLKSLPRSEWDGLAKHISGRDLLSASVPGLNNAFFARARNDEEAKGILQYYALHDPEVRKKLSVFDPTAAKLRKQVMDNGAMVFDPAFGKGSVVGHEAGHAKIEHTPGITQMLQRKLYQHSPLIAPLSAVGGMAAGLATKNTLGGLLAGTGIGLLGGAGMMLPEYMATHHGMKGLKSYQGGKWEQKGDWGRQLTALGTYGALNVLPSAAAGALGGYIGGRRKKRKEEEEGENVKMDEDARKAAGMQ